MTIKIVLPEGDGLRATNGLKVYTDGGHEIQGITRIQCDWRVNEILEATITVEVSEIENLRGIEGIVWPKLDSRKCETVVELGGEPPSEYNECARHIMKGSDIFDTWTHQDEFVMSESELKIYAALMGYSK